MTKEFIISAAVKRNDGAIVEDKDHSNCINKSPKGTCVGKDVIQGFMTSERRFVEREKAAEIAFKANQIDFDPKDEKLYSEDILHSGYCDWDDVLKRYVYNTTDAISNNTSFLMSGDVIGEMLEPIIKYGQIIILNTLFAAIILGILSVPVAAIKYLFFD
jgi:hypothetical protein